MTNWRKIDVGSYIDVDKVCFFKIREAKVYANFGYNDVLIMEFDTLDEAKEFIKKTIPFKDL